MLTCGGADHAAHGLATFHQFLHRVQTALWVLLDVLDLGGRQRRARGRAETGRKARLMLGMPAGQSMLSAGKDSPVWSSCTSSKSHRGTVAG